MDVRNDLDDVDILIYGPEWGGKPYTGIWMDMRCKSWSMNIRETDPDGIRMQVWGPGWM